MLIDKYIENALYLYQCVIVPGFGGFLAVENPHTDSPSTGKTRPAEKVFTFSASLRVNDGVLASYIANMRDISYSEALLEISRAVDFYLSRLAKGDAVDIAGVGMIKPSEDGEWTFTPYGEKSFARENYGLDSSVASPETTTDKPVEEKTEATVTIAEEIPAPCTAVADHQEEEKTEEAPTEETKAETLEESLSITEAEEEKPNISISWEKPEESTKADSTGRTGRMVRYILIAVAALLVIVIYINREQFGQFFSSGAEKPKQTAIVPAQKVVADSVAKDSTATDTVKAVSKPVATTPKEIAVEEWEAPFVPQYRYYVVAASLSIKENAIREIERLRKEGYPAKFAGRQGGLYMIAYGAYDTREEMMEAYDSIRAKHNSEVWVKAYSAARVKK